VDRRIVVSGQGDVTLERDNVNIAGKFGVDEGLIDFTRSDAPSLGSDVTVANRTADELPLPPVTPQRHRNVSIDLGIGLGHHLQLKGRGIDTGLQGELKITTPNGLPAFTGSIRAVGGTYAAYPRLDIEATRPNLDVRVGVAITGTALNVRVRLFSDPDMSDIDKLSWLMLGRASDGLGSSDTALLQRAAMALLAGDSPGVTDQVLQTIGLDDLSVRQTEGDSRDTVVSLGKQLSRRWYVGYERGLNATQGTWQLIYRIARRFTLRAQSGLDNSMDLIWTWRWD
jgi:translocation and assembly module TamB